MEVSVIYDFLAHSKLDNYREKLEKADGNLLKDAIESKEILEKSLNEEQSKLLNDYLFSLGLLEEYIDYQVGMRTMNWGIKIGVQLQHSIKSLEEYLDEPDCYE